MSRGDAPGLPVDAFSAGLVGLEPGPGGRVATAALFQKLLDDDFLPDPLAHEALLALAGQPVRPGSLLLEEAAADDERRRLAEVEGFAAGFFAIPVEERPGRWRALARSGAHHPLLIERLNALRPGLSIDRAAFDDPSPAVRRLADDLFDLFPMRPEPRAVESRDRVLRFRSEGDRDDADRERALKDLRRRHPDLVGLSHGYLEQLARPRRPSAARQVRARVAGIGRRKPEPNRWSYVGITLVLLGAASRLLTSTPSAPRPNPGPVFPANPAFLSPSNRPISPALVNNKSFPRAIREEIKGKLRVEVGKLGKALDEPTLDRLVAGLPVEQLPQVGGLATLVLIGAWTDDLLARFVAPLRDGLASTNLGLDPKGCEELARKCFPRPGRRTGPQPKRSP